MKRQLLFFSIACLISMQYAPIRTMDSEAVYEELRKEGVIALEQLNRVRAGDADAMYELAEKYREAGNEAEAYRWYKKAAFQSHAGALYEMGRKAENSEGEVQDFTEALAYYRGAANQDHANALYALSRMYATGRGVEKDYSAASALSTMADQVKAREPFEHFSKRFTQLVVQSGDRCCNCVCL